MIAREANATACMQIMYKVINRDTVGVQRQFLLEGSDIYGGVRSRPASSRGCSSRGDIYRW